MAATAKLQPNIQTSLQIYAVYRAYWSAKYSLFWSTPRARHVAQEQLNLFGPLSPSLDSPTMVKVT